jgi:hypothetical protein
VQKLAPTTAHPESLALIIQPNLDLPIQKHKNGQRRLGFVFQSSEQFIST